jgi:hypothetical protein
MIPMGLISQAAEDANVLLALPLMIGAVQCCCVGLIAVIIIGSKKD